MRLNFKVKRVTVQHFNNNRAIFWNSKGRVDRSMIEVFKGKTEYLNGQMTIKQREYCSCKLRIQRIV